MAATKQVTKLLVAVVVVHCLLTDHISFTSPAARVRKDEADIDSNQLGITKRKLVLLTSGGLLGSQAASASEMVCEDQKNFQGCTCDGNPIDGYLNGILGDFTSDQVDSNQFVGTPKNPNSFWEFTGFKDGKEVPLAQFKSKATLVVNVASG